MIVFFIIYFDCFILDMYFCGCKIVCFNAFWYYLTLIHCNKWYQMIPKCHLSLIDYFWLFLPMIVNFYWVFDCLWFAFDDCFWLSFDFFYDYFDWVLIVFYDCFWLSFWLSMMIVFESYECLWWLILMIVFEGYVDYW